MKKFIIALSTLMSVSAFGANLSTTIADIELTHNAVCTRTGGSWFNLCSSSIPRPGEMSVAYSCTYSAKFHCISNADDFKLKIRVVEAYNYSTQSREARVVKVKYIR